MSQAHCTRPWTTLMYCVCSYFCFTKDLNVGRKDCLDKYTQTSSKKPAEGGGVCTLGGGAEGSGGQDPA